MKKLKFAAGILLIAAALVLVFLTLFFPNNGMFTALWNAGFFTFRGEPSLVMIYLVSAMSFLLGSHLFARRAKSDKEDV